MGNHKGQQFKIYFKKTKSDFRSKKRPVSQLFIDIAGKSQAVKHSRNIPQMFK